MGQNEIRAFVALDPPPEVKAEAAGLAAKLAAKTSGVRWSKAEGLHLTLRFMAAIAPEEFMKLGGEIAEGFSLDRPLTLRCGGVGGFPDLHRPRVVWAGIGGDLAGLNQLLAQLDRKLAACGVAVERRPFAAHLTLGRAAGREKARGVARAVEEVGAWCGLEWTQKEVTLFESRLGPGGALHLVAATGKIEKSN